MIKKLTKLPFPLIILMSISFLILSAGIAIPICTHMSVPTFISSLKSDKITAEELKILQQNNPNSLILIDVRSPEEYQQGHIEDSILIPLSDIEAGFGIKQISKLVTENPNSTVVLYCSVGVRSLKAYHILEKNGIKTVNLQGGIKSWNKLNE